MGIITVGLNETGRASSTRIMNQQAPGGTSTILSEMYGPDVRVAESAPAKPCHRSLQPPGGTSDIIVTDSSCSSSDTSSDYGDEPMMKPIKKPYRLGSSISIGDASTPMISAPKKMPIKVDPKADMDTEYHHHHADDDYTPHRHIELDEVDMIQHTPAEAMSADRHRRRQVDHDESDNVNQRRVGELPPSHNGSAVSTPREVAVHTPSASAVFGDNVPKLTRRHPPGGFCTKLW